MSDQASIEGMDSTNHKHRLEELEENYSWSTREVYRILLWAEQPLSTTEVSSKLAKTDSPASARRPLKNLKELGYVSYNKDDSLWQIDGGRGEETVPNSDQPEGNGSEE
jgi:predicted transcriptional regulator